MNRSRYEAVPQSEPNPPILLDPIVSGTASYNYNSGTPTSAPSSYRAPSVSSQRSILTSPPPSFHSSQFNHLNAHPNSTNCSNNTTPFPPFSNYPPPPSFHSRSSTPRPTPSQHTVASGGSGVELWGIAPSTATGPATEVDDEELISPLTVVKDLRRRVERLEESLGRLILENEDLRNRNENHNQRGNCCVTFTDASSSLEQNVLLGGHNCCVRFTSSAAHRDRKRKELAVAGGLSLIVVLVFILMVIATANGGNNRGGDIPYGKERST